MPKFHFNAGHKSAKPDVKGGDAPGENLRVYGPRLQAAVKASGVFDSRPKSAALTLTRTIPEASGSLAFLQATIESRGWDNSDKTKDDADKTWPTLIVTYDKQVGAGTQDVQTCELKRLVILVWSLSWEGQGPAGRAGVAFTETVQIEGWNLTRTHLVGKETNKSISLELAPPREG